eukprot:m.497813 g.497813  ORF g.497813 m.497813 type:complete len:364 (+) comp52340_c0_seq1:82-1173(+)
MAWALLLVALHRAVVVGGDDLPTSVLDGVCDGHDDGCTGNGSFSTAAAEAAGALWRDGHVLLRGAVPGVAEVAKEVHRVHDDIVATCMTCSDSNDLSNRDCVGCERTRATPSHFPKSFQKAKNLHRHSRAIRDFVMSPSVAGLAASLLNTPAVRLYQDTSFFKQPGDVESAWHQDQVACPLLGDKVVTLWIPLADVEPEQGTLVFAQGSHGKGGDSRTASEPTLSLRGLALSRRVTAMRYLGDNDLARHFKLSRPAAFRLGDASAHLGWTYHRAGPNQGETPRPALAVTFFADGSKVHPSFLHKGGTSESIRGIEFLGQDGQKVVAQTITDDLSTWLPWLFSGQLQPGKPLRPATAPLYQSLK